jgi:hypothetical protein
MCKDFRKAASIIAVRCDRKRCVSDMIRERSARYQSSRTTFSPATRRFFFSLGFGSRAGFQIFERSTFETETFSQVDSSSANCCRSDDDDGIDSSRPYLAGCAEVAASDRSRGRQVGGFALSLLARTGDRYFELKSWTTLPPRINKQIQKRTYVVFSASRNRHLL